MPYSRQRPRLAPNARIAIRLNTEQRDWFIHSPNTPQGLGHALHCAPVREGKLSLRVTREELDALISAAAKVSPSDRKTDRALNTLLRYLESLEGRFADPDGETDK